MLLRALLGIITAYLPKSVKDAYLGVIRADMAVCLGGLDIELNG